MMKQELWESDKCNEKTVAVNASTSEILVAIKNKKSADKT